MSTLSDIATHTRAGNATMVDSDGVLKWAPHNLLTYSEDFTNAAWVVGANCSKTANTISNTGTTAVYIYQVVSLILADTLYTASMRVQKTTARYFQLTLILGNSRYAVLFDLNDGSFVEQADTVIPLSEKDYAVESLGGGEYLFTITAKTSNSGTGVIVAQCTNSIPATRDANLDLTNATSGVSVTVSQSMFYRSDLGGMVNNPTRNDTYVPTTSAAVYLPRVGHHLWNGTAWVDAGYFHESEARTNLITYSQDFTVATGAWTNINVSTTGTSQGPDGLSNSATQMLETATSGEHQVGEAITLSPSTYYTLSAFVRSIGGRDCTLFWFTNSSNTILQASFDLVSGTVLSGPTASGSAPPTNISANIEKVGSFYRVSISGLVGATGGSGQARVHASDGSTFNYLGDVAKGLDVYGAQLEAGSTPSSYIPTAGSTVTRAADTMTIPAANLPWPEPEVIGPELVTNGTFDSDTDWTKGANWVISGGLATKSSGAANAMYQPLSLSSGKVYRITYTISGSSEIGSVTPTFIGGTPASGTAVSANGDVTDILLGVTGNVGINIVGSSTFDGSIDNISVREINPLAVSIQMSGTMTYADNDDLEAIHWRWYSDASNYLQEYVASTSGTGDSRFLSRASGVSDVVISSGSYYSPGINVPFNIASRHGSTFINGAVDGTALTANTTPTALPDLSATDMDIAPTFMGTIDLFRVWKVDITDAGIEEAST